MEENKKQILIVEDDKESHIIFKRMLIGYEVIFCTCEKSMLSSLSETTFDLILMDIGLPGSKDGLELIKDLKGNSDYSSIPIICYTSFVFANQKLNALNAGADGYLTKPISKIELIDLIEQLLNRPQ